MVVDRVGDSVMSDMGLGLGLAAYPAALGLYQFVKLLLIELFVVLLLRFLMLVQSTNILLHIFAMGNFILLLLPFQFIEILFLTHL